MPCPPGLCAFQADCPDTHCPGNPRGSGEHSDYWPRVNADFLPAMHAPLQPQAPEQNEAQEKLDVPLYTWDSFVPAWLTSALAWLRG